MYTTAFNTQRENNELCNATGYFKGTRSVCKRAQMFTSKGHKYNDFSNITQYLLLGQKAKISSDVFKSD